MKEERKSKTREKLLEDLKFFVEDKPDELNMWQESINDLNEMRMGYTNYILSHISAATGVTELEYNSTTRKELTQIREQMLGLKAMSDTYLHEYVGSCIGLMQTEDQLKPGDISDTVAEERKSERQQLIDMLVNSSLDELATPQQIDINLITINEVNQAYGYFPPLVIGNDGVQK